MIIHLSVVLPPKPDYQGQPRERPRHVGSPAARTDFFRQREQRARFDPANETSHPQLDHTGVRPACGLPDLHFASDVVLHASAVAPERLLVETGARETHF